MSHHDPKRTVRGGRLIEKGFLPDVPIFGVEFAAHAPESESPRALLDAFASSALGRPAVVHLKPVYDEDRVDQEAESYYGGWTITVLLTGLQVLDAPWHGVLSGGRWGLDGSTWMLSGEAQIHRHNEVRSVGSIKVLLTVFPREAEKLTELDLTPTAQFVPGSSQVEVDPRLDDEPWLAELDSIQQLLDWIDGQH